MSVEALKYSRSTLCGSLFVGKQGKLPFIDNQFDKVIFADGIEAKTIIWLFEKP